MINWFFSTVSCGRGPNPELFQVADVSKGREMKKRLPILILAVAILGILHYSGWSFLDELFFEQNRVDAVGDAFEKRLSDIQVEGQGIVVKTLPDDRKGRRHQRFILKLDSGQTLLVAHNIDLAPRIASLAKGDQVAFFGEYEWNTQGGVLHWTHHDPQGRHVSGWLEHKGVRYE